MPVLYYCTSFYPKMLAFTNFAQSCKIQALSLMHATCAGVGVGETVLLNQARQHQLMSEYIDSLFLRLTVKNSILMYAFFFWNSHTLRAKHAKPRLDVSYLVLVFLLLMYILFFQFLTGFAYVLRCILTLHVTIVFTFTTLTRSAPSILLQP